MQAQQLDKRAAPRIQPNTAQPNSRRKQAQKPTRKWAATKAHRPLTPSPGHAFADGGLALAAGTRALLLQTLVLLVLAAWLP